MDFSNPYAIGADDAALDAVVSGAGIGPMIL
jgi:hypothetical protein